MNTTVQSVHLHRDRHALLEWLEIFALETDTARAFYVFKRYSKKKPLLGSVPFQYAYRMLPSQTMRFSFVYEGCSNYLRFPCSLNVFASTEFTTVDDDCGGF